MSGKKVYLITGEDEYQKEEECNRLINNLLPGGADEMNFERFDGSDCSVAELETALLNSSIFTETKVVCLVRCDRMKPVDQDRLSKLLPDIPEGTYCIILVESLDGRMKLAKSLKKLAITKSFKKLYENDTIRWCLDRARYHGLRLGRRGAELMTHLVGADLMKLDKEFEKIRLYLGKESDLADEDIITKVVGETGEAGVFELLDAIGERDSYKALSLLRNMMGFGEPAIKLQYIIFRHLRDLLQVTAMSNSGMGLESIIAKLKIHPYKAKKLLSQSRHFQEERLSGMFEYLLESDLKLKSSEMTPECWLELMVYKVCASR